MQGEDSDGAPSPGTAHDSASAGDATTDRFRYQHRCAAIQFCQLLLRPTEYAAVYCEQWEDILVRRCDGFYVGVQVKSRAVHLSAFEACDSEIIKSIAHFVRLNKAFPGRFAKFRFVTNHNLNSVKQGGSNPKYVIEQFIGKGSLANLRANNPVRLFVEEIRRAEECTDAELVDTLKKIEWQCNSSGFEHMEHDLHDTLCEAYPELNTRYPRTTLIKVADNLTYRAYEASSKEIKNGNSALHDVVQSFDAQKDALIVAGKLIDAAIVKDIVESSLTVDVGNALKSAVGSQGVPSTDGTMAQKLTHGGLENDRVARMKDFKTSMEAQYLRWAERFDVVTANTRLDHLKVLVADDCTEAKIAAEHGGAPIAPQMYQELRTLVKNRVSQKASELYDCGFEQLLGVAGIMTEECSVWWSEVFKLDGG